jgi:hypothetical protein
MKNGRAGSDLARAGHPEFGSGDFVSKMLSPVETSSASWRSTEGYVIRDEFGGETEDVNI